MAERVERLGLYEPKDILPLTVRTGTDRQPLQLHGNSLLSVLFIKAIDVGATVSIKYYDSGSGTSAGEFNLVGEHPIQSAVTAQANRILITRLTNKAVLEWTVTGGSAEFGVYGFVVSSFATDLDLALKLNGAVADLMTDKGLVAMGYDSVANAFYFLPLSNGALVTTSELPGQPRFVSSADGLVTTPGVVQNLINYPVPGGETWRVREVAVTCRAYARFTIYADSIRIGSGRTGPHSENVIVQIPPYHQVLATEVIRVEFLETTGPVIDVEAYVRATNN